MPASARQIEPVANLPSPLAGEEGTHRFGDGEVRGLPQLLARGDSPLTLPASRVPSLSRKGRGKFGRA